MARQTDFGEELDAIRAVLDALGPLDATQRQFVFRTAAERLGLADALPLGKGGASGHEGAGRHSTGGATGGDGSDGSGRRGSAGSAASTPQEFMKAKRPNSEVQRVAALAYYLTHFENVEDFKTSDITDLNTRARGVKLSNPKRAVDNATRAAKVLGPSKGGRKLLTSHGEEVVEALPDQERVKEVLAAFKLTVKGVGRRRGSKKKRGS